MPLYRPLRRDWRRTVLRRSTVWGLLGLMALSSVVLSVPYANSAAVAASPPPTPAPVRAPQPAGPGQPLPAEVRALLEQADVGAQEFGVVVQPVDRGTLRLSYRADQPMNPASTMKLVTTHAAMALLGPGYRWVTSVYEHGRRQGGVLQGDLVLRGGGDPKLVIEDLETLVQQLRATGLTTIQGNLVVDASLYAHLPDARRTLDGEDSAPYNVAPHAALLNFNATRFIYDPRSARIEMDPPLADVRVIDAVQRLPGRCRPQMAQLAVEAMPGGSQPTVRVLGRAQSRCGPISRYSAGLQPLQFIHGLFKAAWERSGGTFTGHTVEGSVPAAAEPLLRWYSPRTLSDVVHDINKFSNNVMTRMLLLQLGTLHPGRPATAADGEQILRAWYQRQGIAMKSLVLDNGSGLSRIGRIAPGELVEVLLNIDRSTYGRSLEESLPLAGVDGTMRHRLRHQGVAGEAWIKTGTLDDSSAIAGFVRAQSGHRYVVVMLVNGTAAPRSVRAQDALLEWVYDHG